MPNQDFVVFQMSAGGVVHPMAGPVVDLDVFITDEIADTLFIQLILVPMIEELASQLCISPDEALTRLIALSCDDD